MSDAAGSATGWSPASSFYWQEKVGGSVNNSPVPQVLPHSEAQPRHGQNMYRQFVQQRTETGHQYDTAVHAPQADESLETVPAMSIMMANQATIMHAHAYICCIDCVHVFLRSCRVVRAVSVQPACLSDFVLSKHNAVHVAKQGHTKHTHDSAYSIRHISRGCAPVLLLRMNPSKSYRLRRWSMLPSAGRAGRCAEASRSADAAP